MAIIHITGEPDREETPEEIRYRKQYTRFNSYRWRKPLQEIIKNQIWLSERYNITPCDEELASSRCDSCVYSEENLTITSIKYLAVCSCYDECIANKHIYYSEIKS